MQPQIPQPQVPPIAGNPDHDAMVFLAQQVLKMKGEIEDIKKGQSSLSSKDDIKAVGDKHSEMDKGLDARIKAVVSEELKGIKEDIKSIING